MNKLIIVLRLISLNITKTQYFERRKIMLQKIGSFYLGVFKKYGIIIPAVLVVISFAIMLSIEATNALTALIHSSKAMFIILACVVGLALVAGTVYTVLKLKNSEIGIHDLGITAISAVALCMLVMYIFAGAGGALGICKWVITAVVLVLCVALSVLRSNHVSE